MAAASSAVVTREAPPWRQRFRAWWEGTELPAPAAMVAAASEAAPAPPPRYRVDRLAISQMLWGDGFLEPGGPEQVLALVKPFGANPAMSMLDLTGGLGGPARVVSTTFNVYVTGRERVPEIAERGMAQSVAGGFAKTAPIVAYDPEKLELRANGFDCAFSQQLLYKVVDKEGFLRKLNQGMKPRGHFAFTDYVLTDPAKDPGALAHWKSSERIEPHPWTPAQYKAVLASTGFDVRVTEDMTEVYRAQIADGWSSLIRRVNLRQMPKPELLALLDEAEIWIHRLNALNAGVLGVMRFYALSSRKPEIH